MERVINGYGNFHRQRGIFAHQRDGGYGGSQRAGEFLTFKNGTKVNLVTNALVIAHIV